MNKLLFGAIGLLLLAIAAIGITTLTAGRTVTTPSPAATYPTASATTTVAASSSPVSSVPSPAADTFTMAQVAAHNSSASCYTAINGSVYDVTSFINQHPGGAQAILSLCGTDGTAAFEGQHGGQSRPASELATFKIGTLSQ